MKELISQKRILNVVIDNVFRTELLEMLREGILITLNVYHLIKLQKNKEFYDVYQSADWVICDSKIVTLGLKFFGTPIKEVILGSSFFPAYYNHIKK